jgi:cathepsin D
MTFGGKTWPVSSGDMNLGPENSGSNSCLGGIFDLGAQTGFSGGPAWVVGDTFLVSTIFSVIWMGN